MKKIIFSISGLLSILSMFAQTQFISKGKIEYERRTNVHRLYFSGEEENSFMEEIKKMVPQFSSDYFDLSFNEKESIYKPGRNIDVKKNTGFFDSPSQANTVYRNFESGNTVSQKQVFESNFLLSDSSKNYTWKIEPEIREIAGYKCRKAITRICDSVVVVAFYSEEILPSGGPESFNGLPGMILGLAVPRLYTTWFATKVEILDNKDENAMAAPTKGKKSNTDDMVSTIDRSIKDWGKYRDRAIWFSSL